MSGAINKGGTFSQGDGAINQLLVSKVPAFIYEMANKTIHNKERDNGKLSRKERGDKAAYAALILIVGISWIWRMYLKETGDGRVRTA